MNRDAGSPSFSRSEKSKVRIEESHRLVSASRRDYKHRRPVHGPIPPPIFRGPLSPRTLRIASGCVVFTLLLCLGGTALGGKLERVKYHHSGLVVDLGVGLWAWPLPMDWDGDGDLDLVVSCPDVPYNGTYFFENPGGNVPMPIFKPAVRVGAGLRNVQVSYVDGKPRVLTPGQEWDDFLGATFDAQRMIYPSPNVHSTSGRVRANQWRYLDYDGDGDQDLIVGVGDWADYGWDDAFNARGDWTRGPLHGYVYWIQNQGNNSAPDYASPVQIQAEGQPVDVFGMPSPNFADFDGDGDLDLLCGEFLDGFTYFQNGGTRTEPRYAAGRRLTHGGEPLRMDLQMITPTAIDWDRDGDIDLIVGDEDGRVAFIEHTGRVEEGLPQFHAPRYFQQQADELKFGALVTPVSVDWDGDGDEDLICGNTAGYIGFFENLDGGHPPKWAAPVKLKAAGEVIRIQAGPNGSIQGPAEAKWGYTTLSVADWDHDGRHDLVVNSIWGKVVWFRNTGTKTAPQLAAAQPVAVRWNDRPPKPAWNWWEPRGNELATQWRTTPVVVDWDEDGLNDLMMLDQEGFLAWYRRERTSQGLILNPGERVFKGGIFDSKHQAKGEGTEVLRLNDRTAGASGRRKLCVADWDGDGRRDLLVNSVNVNFLRNISAEGQSWSFQDHGPMDDLTLAGHTTSPTTVDWDRDGVRDLLVGAEDGFLYHMRNPHAPAKRSAQAKPAGAASATRAGKPHDHRVQILRTPEGGSVPDAEIDAEGMLHLAYVQGEDLFYAKSTGDGATFAPAIQVNSEPGTVHPANGFRGPDLALGRGGRVHVIWYVNAFQRKLPHDQWGVFYSFLKTGGTAFVPARNLNRKPSDNYSLTADGQGRVAVFWMAGSLFLHASTDDGETFEGSGPIVGPDTCECCASRAAYGADGTLYCFYRDKANHLRDMFLLSQPIGNALFQKVKVSGTPWRIEACPMTGAYLAADATGLAAAWETKGEISFARFNGAGQRLSSIEIKAPVQGGKWPVVLAAPDGVVCLSWKKGLELEWQLYDPHGQPIGQKQSRESPNLHRHAGVVSGTGNFILID